MSRLVGVYGTLRYGLGLHGALRGCCLVGLARLSEGNFIMVITRAGYPAVVSVPRGYAHTVGDPLSPLVELYEVPDTDTLVNLDAIEGVPTLYRRGAVNLSLVKSDGLTEICSDKALFSTYNDLQKLYPDLQVHRHKVAPTICDLYYMGAVRESIQGCEIVMNGDFINPAVSQDSVFNYNEWASG